VADFAPKRVNTHIITLLLGHIFTFCPGNILTLILLHIIAVLSFDGSAVFGRNILVHLLASSFGCNVTNLISNVSTVLSRDLFAHLFWDLGGLRLANLFLYRVALVKRHESAHRFQFLCTLLLWYGHLHRRTSNILYLGALWLGCCLWMCEVDSLWYINAFLTCYWATDFFLNWSINLPGHSVALLNVNNLALLSGDVLDHIPAHLRRDVFALLGGDCCWDLGWDFFAAGGRII